jgi:starch synthase
VPGPLAIVVSRLTGQKGIDLLPAVIPDFVAAGGGLACWAAAIRGWSAALADLAARIPAASA